MTWTYAGIEELADRMTARVADMAGSLRMQVALALVCTFAAVLALAGCGPSTPPPDTAQLIEPAKHLMVPPGEAPEIPTNPDCEIRKECRGKYYAASRLDRANLAAQVRGLQAYVHLIHRRRAKAAGG